MPPTKKFPKEDIIKIALEITEKEGFDHLNARRIASKLNSSVQPIFHNFASMEELKSEVYQKIQEVYQDYMLSGVNSERPYKAMGLSYIKFAKERPEFFKIIFMKETTLNAEKLLMSDKIGKEIIKSGQKLTGLSEEDQKKFHLKVWMFTHGIACFVATKTVEFSEKEIDRLLVSTVRELLIGFKKSEEK